NQGVEEKPDQVFKFRAIAVGYRRPDCNIRLAGVPVEEYFKCREQSDKQRDTFLPAQRLQRIRSRLGYREFNRSPGKARIRGPGMVSGQRERGNPGKLVSP